MPRCRQCNLEVSSVAQNCPRCGVPLPARFRISTRRMVVAVAVVSLLIAFVAVEDGRRGGSRETERTQASPAAVAQPFVVAIDASVSGGARPIVTGTTNLPDGTSLLIGLTKPYAPNGRERLAAGFPPCVEMSSSGNSCGSLSANGRRIYNEVVVKNGRFSDGPFTDEGAALPPGTYGLEVWNMIGGVGGIQPPSVLAIIGQHGENLTGPLVNACCFLFPFDMDEKLKERAMNKAMEEERRERDQAAREGFPYTSILYARYVMIEPEPMTSPR